MIVQTGILQIQSGMDQSLASSHQHPPPSNQKRDTLIKKLASTREILAMQARKHPAIKETNRPRSATVQLS